MLEIVQFPCLSDNYGYVIHDAASGASAAIDTPDVQACLAALAERGWRLDYIFNTHHHFDHAGGNVELKEKTGCRIIGPAAERARIPALDQAVGEGAQVMLGESEARVFDVPGHTAGHIAYYFAADKALFCGDTLFVLGCGRLFEGTAAQMHSSLAKLAALPADTRVFCAHEYTEANLRFALSLEPDNPELAKEKERIDALRSRGRPTVPSLLGRELAANPFLRAGDKNLAASLGMTGAGAVAVFAETRRRKDAFRG